MKISNMQPPRRYAGVSAILCVSRFINRSPRCPHQLRRPSRTPRMVARREKDAPHAKCGEQLHTLNSVTMTMHSSPMFLRGASTTCRQSVWFLATNSERATRRIPSSAAFDTVPHSICWGKCELQSLSPQATAIQNHVARQQPTFPSISEMQLGHVGCLDAA